jgi:hypothetical protein
MDEGLLHSRVRRAYELARLRQALRWASVVLPLAALSHTCCISPAALWSLCAAAFAAVLYASWRGQAAGAGAKAGLVAGFAAWVPPVTAQWAGLGFSTIVLALCLGSGVIGGLLVGWQLRRHASGRPYFVLAASVVAGLTGALGCVVAGAGGVAGMALGELLGAAPFAVVALRRAT